MVVVLVLLVATAILAIVVLRSSSMQERMSANLRDRSLAFQAAESALRYAQDQVLATGAWDTAIPDADDCVNSGICPTGSNPNWIAVPASSYDSARLAAAPEYWIEYLGTGPGRKGACDVAGEEEKIECQSPMYRITARSRAEGRADVFLQANVISRIPEPGV
ncbi:pilus assembly PilX family protein [Luteimonas lutimaris]